MNRYFVACLIGVCFAGPVAAETYPTRPVRLIVPYAAGGPADNIGRLVSEKASASLGKTIYIENRGGAGGVIGASTAAAAQPDGYTAVLVSPGQIGIAAATQASLPYDALRDLTPVIELVEDTLILCISNEIPAKTAPELIDYLKKNPDKLNFSSAGAGSITHMSMELFKQAFDVKIQHVPYKATSEAMMAILSNDVSMGFASPGTVQSLLAEGKVRAIAAASARRSTILPDVPTFAELGYPRLNLTLFHAIAVPKATPSEIVKRLHDAYADALKNPQLQEALKVIGVNVIGSDTETARKIFEQDVFRWKALVSATGLKVN